ncbi:MAG TPA: hypothetical protein VIW24_16980 [Aldersonia sp.]
MTEATEDRATSATPVPAVVCDMTDAPDSGEQRLHDYARLFGAAFISRERTDSGMRWRLRADPGIEAQARDLSARENACCAFLTTTVTVSGGQVLWDATTIDDPAARAALDMLYDLPVTQWDDVNEVHDRFVRTTGVPIVGTEGVTTRPATRDEIRFGRGHA